MRLAILTPLLLLTACVPASIPTSERALCVALAPLADAHTRALLVEGVPDAAVVTGADLLSTYDAGCAR